MNGTEVYQVLHRDGVRFLHHANSVTTSCSLLRLRGLASRQCVEGAKLPQTGQYSDSSDKRLGIWNDVFTDGVDIHDRASSRNKYGPVLFRLPVSVLLHLAPGFDVRVTRDNPVRWSTDQEETDRYYMTPADLEAGYSFGDFAKHVVFRSPSGILPFPSVPIDILLDNPNFHYKADGSDVFSVAVGKLQQAAWSVGLQVAVTERKCAGCHCGDASRGGYVGTVVDEMF